MQALLRYAHMKTLISTLVILVLASVGLGKDQGDRSQRPHQLAAAKQIGTVIESEGSLSRRGNHDGGTSSVTKQRLSPPSGPGIVRVSELPASKGKGSRAGSRAGSSDGRTSDSPKAALPDKDSRTRSAGGALAGSNMPLPLEPKSASTGELESKATQKQAPALRKSASTNSIPQNSRQLSEGDLKRSSSLVGSDLEKAKTSLLEAQKMNHNLVAAEQVAADAHRAHRLSRAAVRQSSSLRPTDQQDKKGSSRTRLNAIWSNAARSTAYTAAADAALKAQNWERYTRNKNKAAIAQHGVNFQSLQLKQEYGQGRSQRQQETGTQLLAQGDNKGRQYLKQAESERVHARQRTSRMDQHRSAIARLRAEGGGHSESESDIG